ADVKADEIPYELCEKTRTSFLFTAPLLHRAGRARLHPPGGDQIAFNSDRGGSPQLYVMGANGGNARRISFGEGRYGSPAWSPRGDLIAFTKIKGGFFHIGVMRPDGGDERLLTRSFLDENPSWSPNGRTVMFSREDPTTNTQRIRTIDITGRNERGLTTPLDASDPDWSALLP
ncbi:MAG: hypothetical protein AAFY56_02285, partial [Pseudomonadota bacterium]